MMDPVSAVKKVVLENYANFSGRAQRSEYWWFVLAFVIIAVITQLISTWIYAIIALALLAPALGVGFRRLQDMGKPGWYILIPFGVSLVAMLLTPSMPDPDAIASGAQMPNMFAVAVGGIVSLIQLAISLLFIWWLTRPSQPETNQWGPPPV